MNRGLRLHVSKLVLLCVHLIAWLNIHLPRLCHHLWVHHVLLPWLVDDLLPWLAKDDGLAWLSIDGLAKLSIDRLSRWNLSR